MATQRLSDNNNNNKPAICGRRKTTNNKSNRRQAIFIRILLFCIMQSQCAWVYLWDSLSYAHSVFLSPPLSLFLRMLSFHLYIKYILYTLRYGLKRKMNWYAHAQGIATTTTTWTDFYWVCVCVCVSLWPQTKSKTLLLSLWKIAVRNVKIISCEHKHTDIYTPVTHRLRERESLYWLHRRFYF